MTKHCKHCKKTTYHKHLYPKTSNWILIICNKCKRQVGVI